MVCLSDQTISKWDKKVSKNQMFRFQVFRWLLYSDVGYSKKIYQNIDSDSPVALTVASVFLTQGNVDGSNTFEQNIFTLEKIKTDLDLLSHVIKV